MNSQLRLEYTIIQEKYIIIAKYSTNIITIYIFLIFIYIIHNNNNNKS